MPSTSRMTLDQIKAEVQTWSFEDKIALLNWLENVLEDHSEMTAEFQQKIEAGFRQLAEGQVRVRKPQ